MVRKTRFIACWRKSRERYLQAEDSTGEEVTKGIYTRSTTQRRVRASTPCFACGGWRLGFEDDRQTRDPTPLARHRHYRHNERRYVRQVGATKKGRRKKKRTGQLLVLWQGGWQQRSEAKGFRIQNHLAPSRTSTKMGLLEDDLEDFCHCMLATVCPLRLLKSSNT